jgi:hypothetical protein
MRSTFMLLLCLLLTPAIHAQQTWFPIVSAESQTTTVTFPASATIRWCDAETGKICSPTEQIPAQTTITAYCPAVTQCASDDLHDGLDGVAKSIQIAELVAVTQTVQIGAAGVQGFSVFTVPAIPPPAVAFAPGGVVRVAVSNIPPTTPDAFTAAVILMKDGTTVKMVCLYNNTVASNETPPSLAAMWSCVIQ